MFVRFFSDRGIQYRLGGLILSAVEAVFLKRALAASSPLPTFAVWSLSGFLLSSIAVLVSSQGLLRSQRQILKSQRFTCLALSITTGLTQFFTLVILTQFQVATALALFQTSTLLTVFLGRHIFREPHFAMRLLGSVVMVLGAVLIILSRE